MKLLSSKESDEDEAFEEKRVGLTPWLVSSAVVQRRERFLETSSEDEGVCSDKPRGGEKNFAQLFIYLAISQISPGPTHVTRFRAAVTLRT